MKRCGCLSPKAHWSARRWAYKPAIIIKPVGDHNGILCNIYAKHQGSQRKGDACLWEDQWVESFAEEWVLGLFSKTLYSWPKMSLPTLMEEELRCHGNTKGSLECNLPEALHFEATTNGHQRVMKPAHGFQIPNHSPCDLGKEPHLSTLKLFRVWNGVSGAGALTANSETKNQLLKQEETNEDVHNGGGLMRTQSLAWPP